jgi:hypothetical protein
MSNFKVERIRDAEHRAYIASLPCLINREWNETCVDHHLLRSEETKGQMKACDSMTIPLLSITHGILHYNGNEVVFFLNHGWRYMDILHVIRDEYIANSPSKKIRESTAIYRAIELYTRIGDYVESSGNVA